MPSDHLIHKIICGMVGFTWPTARKLQVDRICWSTFASCRWKGETLRESIKRHEHFLALRLGLKPGMKVRFSHSHHLLSLERQKTCLGEFLCSQSLHYSTNYVPDNAYVQQIKTLHMKIYSSIGNVGIPESMMSDRSLDTGCLVSLGPGCWLWDWWPIEGNCHLQVIFSV
jgi:hypothetical protein